MGRQRTRALRSKTNDLVTLMRCGSNSLFVPLPDGFGDTLSFRLLTPDERFVLLDLWRHIRDKEFARIDTTKTAFLFTYSHCRHDCGRDTFYQAMRFIRYLGWIALADTQEPDYQGARFVRVEYWKRMNWEVLTSLGTQGKIPPADFSRLQKRYRAQAEHAAKKARALERSRKDILRYRETLAAEAR